MRMTLLSPETPDVADVNVVAVAAGDVEGRLDTRWRCCCSRWCCSISALPPTAVLLLPVVLACSALSPMAVLPSRWCCLQRDLTDGRVAAAGGVGSAARRLQRPCCKLPGGVAASAFLTAGRVAAPGSVAMQRVGAASGIAESRWCWLASAS